MKPFTQTIEINLPRDKVIELFDNSENMVHWQNGFKGLEHLSGEPGQVGAKSKIVYETGKHKIDLYETITKRNFPDEFCGFNEWDSGRNSMENKFFQVGGGKTRWESTVSYEMKTFFMKAMALVMSGKFKSQTYKFMENFKAFAETGASVKDETG